MSNNKFSDERLEKIFGRRSKGTPIFAPQELGYRCPLGHSNITWSEFNEFIWCFVCKKDFYYADCVLIKNNLNPSNLPKQPRIIEGITNFTDDGNAFNDIPKEKLKTLKSEEAKGV